MSRQQTLVGRHSRRGLATTLVIVTSVVLSACGVDAGMGTLTEAEFIDQVNSLCAEQQMAIGQAVGPLFGGGEPSAEDMQAALDQIVALSHDLADDIEALAEPASLTEDVEAFVAALDEGTDEAAEQIGAEFFSSDNDPWAEATILASDLGANVCGPDSET